MPELVNRFEEDVLNCTAMGTRDYTKALGDFGEEVVDTIFKTAGIEHETTTDRHPIDFIVIEHYGVELKTVAFTKDKKLRMQKTGRRQGKCTPEKYAFCKKHGLTPITMALWLNPKDGTVTLLYKERFKGFPLNTMRSAVGFFRGIDPAFEAEFIREQIAKCI